TALHLLEGQFAYAEPLRLALQNLALGRGGFDEPPNDTAERVQVVDPEYSPEMAGRLSKLETAISKQRTVRFLYRTMTSDDVAEARIEVQGDTAWWVERTYGNRGRLEEGAFVTDYASLGQLVSWVLRQDGRAVPVAPRELRDAVDAALVRVREAHEGDAPKL